MIIESNSVNAAKLLGYKNFINTFAVSYPIFLNMITKNGNEDFIKEVFRHLKIHPEDFLLDIERNRLSNASINAIAKYNENIRQDKEIKSLLHKKGFKYLELENLTEMVYGDVVAEHIKKHNSIKGLANFLNELGIERVINFGLKELVDIAFGKLKDDHHNNLLTELIQSRGVESVKIFRFRELADKDFEKLKEVYIDNLLTKLIERQDIKSFITLLEHSKKISAKNIISIAENWSKDNIKIIFEHPVVQDLNKNYLLQYLKSTYLNKESNYIKAATKYTKDLNKFEELKHLLKKFGIKEVASFNSLELIKLGFKDLSFDLIEPYIKGFDQVKKNTISGILEEYFTNPNTNTLKDQENFKLEELFYIVSENENIHTLEQLFNPHVNLKPKNSGFGKNKYKHLIPKNPKDFSKEQINYFVQKAINKNDIKIIKLLFEYCTNNEIFIEDTQMKNFIQKAVSNKFFEITRTLIKSRDIIKSKGVEIDNKEFIKEIAKNITAPENLELFEVALKYEGYPINFETTINSQGIIEDCNILGDI